MEKERISSITAIKENIFPYLFKFAILLGISVFAPFLRFQAVTGTIVNAVIIISVIILGKKEAIMLGIFPSLIAIISGLLVPVATPLIPFIIFGNIILIFAVSSIGSENYWKGVISGSIAKFLFLSGAGIVLVKVMKWNNLGEIVSVMFSWQQLLTALAGGAVAYVTLKFFKKI